ncbi:MAG TPA: hypothetical protein VNU72_06680, partial [Puia sp.]|nr:hypothetical protein [Puia sp.]
KPLLWFHLYWWLAGGCLLILAFLFFIRGTNSHFTERLRLARQRYRGRVRPASLILFTGFLAAAGYIYYNVSFLNAYLTPSEHDQRRAQAEKELKHFETLPLPTVIRAKFQTDLYPYEQRQLTKAIVTIQNKLAVPIDSLLLDGDNLTEYTLKYKGALLPYQCPLFYPRGKFNIFRPALDSGDYRLYILPAPLLPGDSASVEIQSLIAFRGFRNEGYGFNMLYNGSVYNGGLPGLGYDDDEELRRSDKRAKYGLPPRVEKQIAHGDPEGTRRLDAGADFGLTPVDITVSTAGDQWAVAPGRLDNDWIDGGRHYFHYAQQGPGIYPPFLIFSARYARKQDTVCIEGSSPVRINLYYHPPHHANLDRLMAANKDGLRYMSDHFGAYPFGEFSFVEGSVFAPNSEHFPGITLFSEHFGWNARFTDPKQNDYLYYRAAEMLAFQWWGGQVPPNHTSGSPLLSAGISKYLSMVLMEKKYGKDAFSDIHVHEMYDYLFYRVRELRNGQKENNLLYADNPSIWIQKAGLILFGLKDLAGEENINAALREFHEQWAFRDHAPYPGSEDLYKVMQQHVPDSMRYFLTDTWEKITLYDNKIVEAKSEPVTTGGYKLTLRVLIRKVYIDSAGQDHPATGMKDYIDIGVFGAGHRQLYLKKLAFSEGEHTIELWVTGKPEKVAIDPYMNLIDRIPEDNNKNVSP